MERYVKVYPWEVLRKVEEDEKVFLLDRDKGEVFYVNGMVVGDLLKVLRAEDKANRYEFWSIEVKEDGEL